MSATSGAGLDRTLRITAGVLGVVVAVPSFLAFLFVVLFVWLGSEDIPIWLAVPLGVLAIVQLYLSIRTLSARLATAVTVGLLGVLELVVGIFLLLASPTLLPATVVAIVVVLIAGGVALTAAVRIHRGGRRSADVAAGPGPEPNRAQVADQSGRAAADAERRTRQALVDGKRSVEIRSRTIRRCKARLREARRQEVRPQALTGPDDQESLTTKGL